MIYAYHFRFFPERYFYNLKRWFSLTPPNWSGKSQFFKSLEQWQQMAKVTMSIVLIVTWRMRINSKQKHFFSLTTNVYHPLPLFTIHYHWFPHTLPLVFNHYHWFPHPLPLVPNQYHWFPNNYHWLPLVPITTNFTF